MESKFVVMLLAFGGFGFGSCEAPSGSKYDSRNLNNGAISPDIVPPPPKPGSTLPYGAPYLGYVPYQTIQNTDRRIQPAFQNDIQGLLLADLARRRGLAYGDFGDRYHGFRGLPVTFNRYYGGYGKGFGGGFSGPGGWHYGKGGHKGFGGSGGCGGGGGSGGNGCGGCRGGGSGCEFNPNNCCGSIGGINKNQVVPNNGFPDGLGALGFLPEFDFGAGPYIHPLISGSVAKGEKNDLDAKRKLSVNGSPRKNGHGHRNKFSDYELVTPTAQAIAVVNPIANVRAIHY